MKHSYSYLLVAGLLAAASGVAHAQNWLGTTDQAWTDGTNWDGGVAPTTGGWIVNLATGNTPIITTAVDNTGTDSWIGDGGAPGLLDINAGGSIDSSTKWLFVGGTNALPGEGTLNVNTGASYTSDNEIRLGRSGGIGTLNVDGTGTVTVSALDEGGGTATINITNGGTVTTTVGNIRMPVGGGSMDSGSLSSAGQIFIGGGAGISTFEMTGGTLSTQSWLPIGFGLDNVGTLNFSGGTVDVCQDNGATTISAAGQNAIGVVNMTAGTWTNGSEGIVLGENGTGTGTFTLDGGDLTTTRIRVGLGATATGALNLNGGTLSTGSVESGDGTASVNLNGTPITANADSTTFFSGPTGVVNLLMDTTIDTAGFNVSGDTPFNGAGSLIKNGAGTLGLTSDLHDITGNLTVNEGIMILGAGFDTPYAGQISVADGAGFGVRVEFPGDLIEPSDLSFAGAATSLDFDFGNPDFEIPSEPIIVGGGTFAVSGTISVNISGENLASGEYVLLDYSGATMTGSATWQVGTLPNGISVAGGVVDTGSAIKIELVAPAPLWVGDVDGNWDTTTLNWIDQGTFDPVAFASGDLATFDDDADTFNVTTTEDVTPSLVKFVNDSEGFTLTAGGGVIAGGTGLTKQMAGDLTITSMANTYTGLTSLQGGSTNVDVLPNGGVAGPLGAASSDPSNLELAGGTLNYTGASISSDRGFTVAGDASGISTQNDLTLTGEIAATAGNLTKSGPGALILTNIGTSTIGVGNPALIVNEGLLNFSGSGTQVMNVGSNVDITNGASVTIVDSTVNVTNSFRIGNGSVGSATLTSGILAMTDEIFVGEGAGGDGTLDITAGTVNVDNWIAVGRNGSTGVMNVNGGTVNVAITDGTNFLAIGSDLGAGNGHGTVNQNGGTLSCPGLWSGEGSDSQGHYNLNAGDFNCTQDAVILGKQGNGVGTFTNNGGTAIVTGNVLIADLDTASGLLTLNGGTFATNNVVSGASTGTSTLSFNGGTLIANESNATFIDGLTTCEVQAGGGTIDTNGFDPIVPQSISGSGDLTKTGAGTLTLSGTSSHSGTLVVATGIVATTGTTALHGSSGVDVKTGAILNLEFTGDQSVVQFLINGVAQADGTYNVGTSPGVIIGGGNLVVEPFVASPYDTWIASFFPGVSDPAIIGADADPDGDGQSNKVEFALGGVPNDGGNNAKIYEVIADRLLLTIAVLETTPAFSAGPAPSATVDGCTYTITGSDDLVAFDSAVSVVAEPVTDGLPAAPTGYEYRTFSLDSSVGFPDKGFMRVEITP